MAQSCDRIISGLRTEGFFIEVVHFTNRGKHLHRHHQSNGAYTAINFEDSEAHTLNVAWNYITHLDSFDAIACFGGYLSMIAAPIFAQWKGCELITFIRGNDFDTSIFNPKKRGILEDLLKRSKIVFCVSQDKADKITHWLPEAKVAYVPNGIDLGTWTPSQSEEQFALDWRKENCGDRLCLGLFGQLKPKKGSAFFFKALGKTNLKDHVHLLLVGELEQNLIDLLHELDLSYSSLSFLDRYALLKHYLCCNAMAIPSFYDGMPNVMLEAGALGIPIIGSHIDGMKDMIEHEKDGLLFTPGDEGDCRKMLYHFFSLQNQMRKNLGANLKAKITSKFTLHHEINAYKEYLI